MISIKLIQISSKHYKFLYNLLAERKPHENISHKKLPSYSTHVKFIKSKPYSKWVLIEYRDKIIGSAYLSKNNEIAIWIKKSVRDYKMAIRKKILQEIITKFTRKKYFANLNPRNKKMIDFYKTKANHKRTGNTFLCLIEIGKQVGVLPDGKLFWIFI